MEHRDIRGIGIFANKASIGLSLFAKGNKDIELLEQGLIFCDKVKKLIEESSSVTGKGEKSRLEAIINLASSGPGPELEIGVDDTGELVEDMRRTFVEMMSEDYTAVKSQIDEVQEKLFKVSSIFYRADLTLLRQVKEKKGLKAYG